MALGALLYGPATTTSVASRLLGGHWPSLTAVVLCLEDAVADIRLEDAETVLAETLEAIAAEIAHGRPRGTMPFVFVRVRGPEHFERLLARLGPLSRRARRDRAAEGHRAVGRALPGHHAPRAARPRPAAVGDADPRRPGHRAPRAAPGHAARACKDLLAAYRDLVPCMRIGATDLSGLWGLRRSRDFTVYDLAAVADVIADIVNVFGRSDGAPAISGPVWEYIHDEPVFKPRLRETPFTEAFGADGAASARRC